MGVAKSDFSQMHRSSLDLIKNAEHFARIDLDQSIFEKERNHFIIIIIIIINEIYRAQNLQGQQMCQVSCCMITVILEQEHLQSFPEHWQ